jgi:hypothetical protein
MIAGEGNVMTTLSNFELQHAQILATNHGGLLVPLKTVAKIFSIKTQSVYNKIERGTFKFEVIKDGTRGYVRSTDLAEFLAFGKLGVIKHFEPAIENPLPKKKKRGPGRPPNDVLVLEAK